MKPKNEIDRNFSNNFDAQLKSIRNTETKNCPPAELLYHYFNKELSGKEQKIFEDHLDLCPLCFSALDGLKTGGETEMKEIPSFENWSDAEKELDKKFYTSLESIPTSKMETAKVTNWKNYFDILRTKWFNFLDIFLAPRIIAYAGSIAVLLVISLYSFAYFSRSNYYYLADIKQEKQVTLRTETTTSLTESLELFENRKYNKAIDKLEFYLLTSPGNYSANYYLGLAFLFISKTGLPGLPYKYDTYDVKKGIQYLESALLFAKDNHFYQEDCYWYLGKAFLMIEEIEKAKTQFNRILDLDKINLIRKNDTRKMLLLLK